MEYFISKNYCEQGPFSEEQLRDMKLRGELTGEWYACPAGEANWLPLSEIALLDQGEEAGAKNDAGACPFHTEKTSSPTLHPLTGFPTALTTLLVFGILFSLTYYVGTRMSVSIPDSSLLMLIGTFIILMNWCYRIAENANIIAGQNKTITSRHSFVNPALFVTSFFLPIYNLIAPYIVLQRIYLLSISPSDKKPKRFSWLVTIYWLLGLGVIVLFIQQTCTIGLWIQSEYIIGAHNDVFLLFSIHQVFLCLIVQKLTRAQRAKAKLWQIETNS